MADNGWSNDETETVAVWMDRDLGMQETVREIARDIWDNAAADEMLTRQQAAWHSLSNIIKQLVKQENPLAEQASMFSDLLDQALTEVDWRQIAEHFLESMELPQY